MTRSRVLLAVVVVAAAAALTFLPGAAARATTTEPAAPGDGFTTITAESFSGQSWWLDHGLASRPWHTGVLADADGDRFLRTQIAAGSHDGTSFMFKTGTADHVRLTYELRLDAAFDPGPSKSNVKLPGFGSPSLTAAGACLSGCGGAGADGITGYSARVDIANTGIPGFYVYDLPALVFGRGVRWAAPRLTPNVWHDVQLEIAMNTPGMADGVLEATLDGVPVYSASHIAFRTQPLLHVGSAWFDIYYGGTGVAPATTYVDLDDIHVEAL